MWLCCIDSAAPYLMSSSATFAGLGGWLVHLAEPGMGWKGMEGG